MAATTKKFSGTRLRELRKPAGVSAMQLAWACSRSEQTVYLWEQGRMRPMPELLDLIASVLGCSREDLFEDDGRH